MITLNNGVEMPALGLGVFDPNTIEATAAAVATAIASGYRLIDTAASYLNEAQVGEGIVRSGIARSDVFITTKLRLTEYGYERALRAFDASVRRLRVNYVDLYLLHWPVPVEFERTVASYRAAEQLLADRRVRAIGVSNFNAEHLKALIERTEVVPAVNQIELHPFFIQRDLREANARLGIVTESWSPLGGGAPPGAGASAVRSPLAHPTVVALAAKYRKTPAQVVLRWHIDHGLCAIPKSFRPERIAENIDIFDFALSRDDIAAIDAMDTGVRGGPDPDVVRARTSGVSGEE